MDEPARVATVAGPTDHVGARVGLFYAAVALGQSLGTANAMIAPGFAAQTEDLDTTSAILAMFALPAIAGVIAIALVAKRHSVAPARSFDTDAPRADPTPHDGGL